MASGALAGCTIVVTARDATSSPLVMTSLPAELDTAVVGGGFLAPASRSMLRSFGQQVVIIERGPTLLGRASLRNQARVHNGYHYPRSILTSLRSRLNYARFLGEYSDCVDRSFPRRLRDWTGPVEDHRGAVVASVDG